MSRRIKPGAERPSTFDAEALDHYGALRQLAGRVAHNRAEAEDLVQDAYVRALRASHRFSQGTNLKAWLRTILRNVARNKRRDHYRARVHFDEHEFAQAAERHGSDAPSPEQALLNQVIAPQLQTALESLPKALRDAVWLRDVKGFSYSDMAKQLRIPAGTVMSRISRGRRLLHDRLLEAQTRKEASHG